MTDAAQAGKRSNPAAGKLSSEEGRLIDLMVLSQPPPHGKVKGRPKKEELPWW